MDANDFFWYRMVLYGTDLSADPVGQQTLRDALARVGLLGPAFDYHGETFHLPGERFLDLVVFLGCSPVIELQRQDDADGQPRMNAFCHVRLTQPSPQPYLQVGDPAAVPRCPHCRASVPQWREVLPAWQAQPLEPVWHCPACGKPASAAQINWRQGAAVCRQQVELGGIHPYEAVPADELLSCLEQASGQRWKYFYARP